MQRNVLANKDTWVKEPQTDGRFFSGKSRRWREVCLVARQTDRAQGEKTNTAEEGGSSCTDADQKAEVRQAGRTQVEGSGLALVIFFFSTVLFFGTVTDRQPAVRGYFTGNKVFVQVKTVRI